MEVKTYFEQMTPELRQRARDHYIRIIALEKREIIEYNRKGAEIKRGQLAHMIPHWERGLAILEELMNQINKK